MRQGAARPRGHDGLKRVPFAAAPPEGVLQPPGNFQLGLPHPDGGQNLAQRFLGELGRRPERLDSPESFTTRSASISSPAPPLASPGRTTARCPHGEVLPLESQPDPRPGLEEVAEPAPQVCSAP